MIFRAVYLHNLYIMHSMISCIVLLYTLELCDPVQEPDLRGYIYTRVLAQHKFCVGRLEKI
jgi:hypothetical protein